MGLKLGRVSGPLLASNLLRNGETLAFDTDLLYFDVTSGYVGIKTNSPSRELTVETAITPAGIVDTQAEIADLIFVNNKIQNVIGKIYIRPNQSIDPTVTLIELQTQNLSFSEQLINNITPNNDINITANNDGYVKFYTTTVIIDGDLHATGDITVDGPVTFGDTSDDSVTFNVDITSNITPDISDTYNLGTSSATWQNLFSTNVIASDIRSSTDLTVNDIDITYTTANTIYVSINGNDTNYGNHLHSTYRTIKKALSMAASGNEIIIFPGTYDEIFPLTIPQNVSIQGSNIQAVIIKPTVATRYNDAFLLNGGSSVSFLTITDFFFNSVGNTGYAFKLASDFISANSSPYIYNVTVSTSGSVTTLTDPLGFNQSDAGAGAYLDGSVANSSSTIPSVMFSATTFITPNQDALTATNGVRIECTDSFILHAKRGIYLTTGALGFAQEAVTFGAELYSINSTSAYGTYGVVADGSHTKGYLTGHQFSYVGSGGDSSNDDSLTIQANEITPINGGILYYYSANHHGDIRVGDIFYVNQSTGVVAVNAQSISFNATGRIVLGGPNGGTRSDAHTIHQANIVIHDNNISSLYGPVNLLAASTISTLRTDVFVTGIIDVTGNVNVKGNVFFGNTEFDQTTIFPKLTQSINPKDTNTYTLGTSDIRWRTAFLTSINIDNVTQITNNTVTTLTADTDLRLIASGTGEIYVPDKNVEITNDLTIDEIVTVLGDTTLQDTEVLGTITQDGDIQQTGNSDIEGTFRSNDVTITGSGSYIDIPNINIVDNIISVTVPDTNLIITADGTAGVIIDSKIKVTNTTISNNWLAATDKLQKSIIFSPGNAGHVVINSTKFLQIPRNNSSNVLTAAGEIRQNNATSFYEGFVPGGLVSFSNLYDTGRNTYVSPELTWGTNDNTLRFGVNGTVIATITETALFTNSMIIDNINIIDNHIDNIESGADLVILPNGTGYANLNGMPIRDGKIVNSTNTALVLNSTGGGYIKFGGSGAVVFPSGATSARRLLPELGETRFNTTLAYLEIFNGDTWQSAAGSTLAASEADVIEELGLWSLILG